MISIPPRLLLQIEMLYGVIFYFIGLLENVVHLAEMTAVLKDPLRIDKKAPFQRPPHDTTRNNIYRSLFSEGKFICKCSLLLHTAVGALKKKDISSLTAHKNFIKLGCLLPHISACVCSYI